MRPNHDPYPHIPFYKRPRVREWVQDIVYGGLTGLALGAVLAWGLS